MNPLRFPARVLACAGLVLAASSFGAPASASAPLARPNILFILAEDIGPQLGCYGEPLVSSPNIDALAARGVRYTRTFTTAPVCSASRSALMTGMYQTSIGAHHHRTWAWNKKPLPEGVRTITDYLRDAGYFTANLSGPGGKKAKKEAPGGLKITGADGTGKTDFNFAATKPFDGNDWKQRAPGQPFFAQISINESHKGDGWTLARSKDSPVGHVDAARVRLPPYTPDHPVAREEFANYLDAIALMDHYVGEVLGRLKKEGLAESTVVVFMGDNGQCLFRSKQFLYDGGLHVPLVIAWPDGRRAGAVDGQLISGIDISAALLGLAGVKPGPAFQGRDFLAEEGAVPRTHVFAARDRMDESTDRMRAVRTERWKYIRNYFPAIPYMQHNAYKEKSYPTWGLVKELAAQGKLTAEAALFAADHKPIEELYDLSSDRHEVRNLAADPAHAAILRELRAQVDHWVVETGDQGTTIEDPLDIYKGYNGRLPDETEGRKPPKK